MGTRLPFRGGRMAHAGGTGYDNREIVMKYIHYKLSQRGYEWDAGAAGAAKRAGRSRGQGFQSRTRTVAASSFLSLCPRRSGRDLPRRGRLRGAALWPRPARSGVKRALSSGRGRLLFGKSPSPRGAPHSPTPVSLRPGVRAETNPVDGGLPG